MNCDVCGYYMLHCRCPEDAPPEAQAEIARLQAELSKSNFERDNNRAKLEVAKSQRDTAWNDAIEAAADCLERNWMETSAYKASAIRALKRTRGM